MASEYLEPTFLSLRNLSNCGRSCCSTIQRPSPELGRGASRSYRLFAKFYVFVLEMYITIPGEVQEYF